MRSEDSGVRVNWASHLFIKQTQANVGNNSNKANQPLLLIKSGLFPAGTGRWEAKQFTDPQL